MKRVLLLTGKDEEGEEMKQHRYANYIIEVICSNCHMRTRIKVPVGIAIELTACPKCGLPELHHPYYFGIKDTKGITIDRKR